MNNLIVDGLLLNEKIDFTTLLLCLGTYFLLFWVSICTWVYYDALKRYENRQHALLAALGVFVLFFPGLIFYFAIRPHLVEHMEIDHLGGEEINIPIINYAENQGVNLNLRISLQPLSTQDINPDRDIEIKLNLKDSKKYADTSQISDISYTNLAPILFIKKAAQNLKQLLNKKNNVVTEVNKVDGFQDTNKQKKKFKNKKKRFR